MTITQQVNLGMYVAQTIVESLIHLKTVSLINFRNTLLVFAFSEATGSTKPNSNLTGWNYFVTWERRELCKTVIMTF